MCYDVTAGMCRLQQQLQTRSGSRGLRLLVRQMRCVRMPSGGRRRSTPPWPLLLVASAASWRLSAAAWPRGLLCCITCVAASGHCAARQSAACSVAMFGGARRKQDCLRVAIALTFHPCRRRRLQEAEQRLSEAQLEADQARSMVAASDEKVAVASEAAVAADARAADAQQAAVVAATREQAARQAAEAVQLALQESQR